MLFLFSRVMSRHYILLSSIFLYSNLSFANNDNTERDLFELSFDELLNVTIDLATKTNETLQSVPSSITLFSKQQIQQLAINNAYDIINFVPGFQITRGDWVGSVPKEHARGVFLDNGYILVMINGQRLNEISFGKASVYTPYIPAAIVERVEFIRGPGSALYGSNAFLGVMNVITEKNTNEVELSLGSNGLWQISSSLNRTFNNNVKLNFNLALDYSNGQNYDVPVSHEVSDPLKSTFLEIGLDYKKLNLSMRYNKVNLDEFMNLGGYSKQNEHQSDNIYASANYTWYQNETNSLQTKLLYSEHNISSSGVVIPKNLGIVKNDFLVGPLWTTTDLNLNIDHQIQFSSELSLTSGVEIKRAEQIKAGVNTSHFDKNNGIIIPADEFYLGGSTEIINFIDFNSLKQSIDADAIYAQLKWQTNTNISVFAGARYDDVKGIDSKISPRLAFVYQSGGGHSLKLQYGESFRTPVTNELYSNDEVTSGNPQLTSEFVKTTELVWQYNNDQINTEIVFFNNDMRDFINKVVTPLESSDFTFDNNINKKMQGIETSLNWTFSNNLDWGMTATILLDDPINESYKNFGTTYINYKINKWQLSINAIIRDELSGQTATNKTFSASSYSILSASLMYNISDISRLAIRINNLLDKEYMSFDPRVPSGEVPGQGQQIRFTLQYLFD